MAEEARPGNRLPAGRQRRQQAEVSVPVPAGAGQRSKAHRGEQAGGWPWVSRLPSVPGRGRAQAVPTRGLRARPGRRWWRSRAQREEAVAWLRVCVPVTAGRCPGSWAQARARPGSACRLAPAGGGKRAGGQQAAGPGRASLWPPVPCRRRRSRAGACVRCRPASGEVLHAPRGPVCRAGRGPTASPASAARRRRPQATVHELTARQRQYGQGHADGAGERPPGETGTALRSGRGHDRQRWPGLGQLTAPSGPCHSRRETAPEQKILRNSLPLTSSTRQPGKQSMTEADNRKDLEENTKRSLSDKFLEQTISYNVSETERPEGLKVRFKTTVVTGKKAAALDARQAEAIRRLLEWTLQHRQQQDSR
jgi:hypothetical protein